MVDVQEHATALADAIDAALPGWVERSVARRMAEAGRSEPDVDAAAAAAGARAQREVGPRVRALLDADIDEQRSTPLSLLREAARYPTEVLRAAGVEPAARDEMQERLLPDDVYDLAPATFADVDPALTEPGLAWGAAKAWTHRRRHGAPPLRSGPADRPSRSGPADRPLRSGPADRPSRSGPAGRPS